MGRIRLAGIIQEIIGLFDPFCNKRLMRKKICFVVAVPITVQAFLRDHIEALSKDYDVYLTGNIKEEDVKKLALTGWHCIEIERGISVWSDLKAVWHVMRYFRKMKFDAVHSVTPKAGMVTAIAGWLAGIRHRTHIFTGQVWATQQGGLRWVLKSIDKLIAGLNNHLMVDGRSQRAFLIKEGVLREGQAEVFANGSICGVNSVRFAPDYEVRKRVRQEIGIREGVLCYIFVGRMNHDKGIGELYEAFDRLAIETEDIFLLLVGDDEGGYLNLLPKYKNIVEGKNFHYYGLTQEPENVLNAGDVFVLPTWREGFGSSVLEAACVGLPCICSDAYGVMDAYIENETGLKCKVGDADSLYHCMRKMYDDRELVKRMGEKSRERALRDFNVKDITACWVEFYRGILGGG